MLLELLMAELVAEGALGTARDRKAGGEKAPPGPPTTDTQSLRERVRRAIAAATQKAAADQPSDEQIRGWAEQAWNRELPSRLDIDGLRRFLAAAEQGRKP